jgi:hypothetical protein|tara:strand:+ start:555 stop:962 length:408 start_codon:yes stop_codon:yes gene_type:complete
MDMEPSYKDLLTIYYNSIIVPKYEWMDGIIVDHLEIVDGLAKGKIRVITNFETIKGMSPLEFYDKTGGVKGSEITNLLLGGEAESYIGLPKNSINNVKSDISLVLTNNEKGKTELDERIINIFKTNKPITTLGMF